MCSMLCTRLLVTATEVLRHALQFTAKYVIEGLSPTNGVCFTLSSVGLSVEIRRDLSQKVPAVSTDKFVTRGYRSFWIYLASSATQVDEDICYMLETSY